MRIKKIEICSNMCSGSTTIVRIYFKEGEREYCWEENTSKLRRYPTGSVSPEEVKKIIQVLEKEKVKRRFTREGVIIRKALRSIRGQGR